MLVVLFVVIKAVVVDAISVTYLILLYANNTFSYAYPQNFKSY